MHPPEAWHDRRALRLKSAPIGSAAIGSAAIGSGAILGGI
jgi:hypothetical protein